MEISVQQLCDEVMHLLNTLKAEYNAVAERHGLTHVQLFALYTIDKHGEIPMGQMAEALHCDASNITGIVDRLVIHGYVTRKECVNDRRAKRLYLTAEGSMLLAQVKAGLPAVLGCNKLDADERKQVHQLMQKMHS